MLAVQVLGSSRRIFSFPNERLTGINVKQHRLTVVRIALDGGESELRELTELCVIQDTAE